MENQSSQRRDSDAQIFSAQLLNRKWLSSKAYEVELSRPETLRFKPGQTLCFIYKSEERYYSFVSSPDDPTIALCVRHVETGFFSPFINRIYGLAPVLVVFLEQLPHEFFFLFATHGISFVWVF